jgi:hypothetical protein
MDPYFYCPTCGQPVNTMDDQVLDNFAVHAEPDAAAVKRANNRYKEFPDERIVGRQSKRGRPYATDDH